MEFSTERLTLRPIQVNDAAFYFELVNQESWKKMIGELGIASVQQAEIHISTRLVEHFNAFGYGFYVMETKSNSQPIGICGITNRQGLKHPDIGFALRDQFAGKGYATEACTKLITEIPSLFRIKKMNAIALPTNTASNRVLEKLQFSPVKRIQLPDDTAWLQLYERRFIDKLPK